MSVPISITSSAECPYSLAIMETMVLLSLFTYKLHNEEEVITTA